MATINLSLPDQMKQWIEGQTEGGRYGDAADYIRDLIRREQEKQASIAELQRLIDEGRASGVSTITREELLREARAYAGVASVDGL